MSRNCNPITFSGEVNFQADRNSYPWTPPCPPPPPPYHCNCGAGANPGGGDGANPGGGASFNPGGGAGANPGGGVGANPGGGAGANPGNGAGANPGGGAGANPGGGDGAAPELGPVSPPPWPPEPPVNRANLTMTEFSIVQAAYILRQLIMMYPTSTFRVFTTMALDGEIDGVPVSLYEAPLAPFGGLLVLRNGTQFHAVPLELIAAIALGETDTYNTSIRYLDCRRIERGADSSVMEAIRYYLPVDTAVELNIKSDIYASGTVIRNECDVLVLSDGSNLNPVFVFTPFIEHIITPPASGSHPRIELITGA